MNSEEVDEIFDKSFLKLIRDLHIIAGLWPYKPKIDKFCRRIFGSSILFIVSLPSFLGMHFHCGKDLVLCSENIIGVIVFFGTIVKYAISMIMEKQLKILLKKIAINYKAIKDPQEHEILNDFVKSGKLKAMYYIGSCSILGIVVSQVSLLPTVLDFLIPLNETRKKILVVNGVFPFEPLDHYYKLYVTYFVACIICVFLHITIDTTFSVIVHLSAGVFRVVKYRLEKASEEKNKDIAYDTMVSATRLHTQAFQFLNLIEKIYQLIFMCIIIVIIFCICLSTVLMYVGDNKPIDFIKLYLFDGSFVSFIFYISVPGQLVIEHSESLFFATYAVKWYKLSKREKTSIKIIMVRCVKPVYLTAGGLYVLDLQNFGSIVKTIVSYTAVVRSLLK